MRRVLILVALLAWTSASSGQAPREHPRLFPVVVADRYGYIDATGKMSIAPRFKFAGEFSAGRAQVLIADQWGYIDTTGAVVIEARFDMTSRFSEGVAVVELGGKRGFIDPSGRFVIEPRFDVATGFVDGRSQVMTGRTLGYIDHTGKLVIRLEFPNEFRETLDFSQGLAPVLVRDTWGYIDTTGAMVIAPQFRRDPRTSEKWSLRFSEGRAAVSLGGKWGYIDRTGRVVIPPRFDEAGKFDEGLAAVRVGPRYGYIDTTGTIVIAPQFVVAWGFSEGLAAVRDSSKRSGYIDHTGKVVIAPQWREVQPFSGGLACVRRDGECEYIDRTGRYVWQVSAVPVAERPVELPDTTPLGGTGSLVDRVAAVVDRAEALEAGRPVDRAQGEIMGDVAKAVTQLSAYLSREPNDVRALILSVRLGRLRHIAQPLVVQRGDTLPTFASLAAEYTVHHAALNRVLALEPNNAEAHYWKARLYALSHNWMGMLYGVTAPPPSADALAKAYADSAVRYGRRSVALAPERLAYREALAVYLILTQQEQEAAAVLRDVDAGNHPMSVLLANWQAIPMPPGAVRLPAHSRGLAQMMMDQESLSDYPFLRARMYVVMTPADSVQAFYQKRWPGFRLIPMEDQRRGDARMRSYSQYLRWQGAQVIPGRDKSEIPNEPAEGVVIALIEIVNPPAEVRRQFPVPLGRVFSSLSVVDLRRFGVDADPAPVAAMKSDLRMLVVAEEAFYADSARYTSRVDGLEFRPSEGNTLLSLQLTEDGWTARIGHANTPTICTIYVGSTPLLPATKEAVPTCS